MAIVALVGLPGSGKSYNAVANQIIPALRQGRKVVTNIPLNEATVREHVLTGEIVEFPIEQIEAQPDSIAQYATSGCVLVLDEVWRLFPAGQKVDKAPMAFKKLLAEHRHMVDAERRSMQIVLVTQDLGQIAQWARLLVDETFLHKKLGHLGADGSYSCSVYRAGVTGQNPPQNSLVRTMHGRYDKQVYQFYKSHTMSEAEEGGANEKKIDRRAVIWKRPIFLFIVVGIVALAVIAPRLLAGFFHTDEEKERERLAAASGATGRPAASKPQRQGGGVLAVFEAQYRVSAIFGGVGEANAFAVLTDDGGDVVHVPASDCQYSRMQWRCEYKKKWWPLRPSSKPVKDGRPIFTGAIQSAEASS